MYNDLVKVSARFYACRIKLLDMADHPEGADLSKEQAVVIVCSTQVCPWQRQVHVAKVVCQLLA